MYKHGGVNMSDFNYEIIKKLGVLSESDKSWAKELNLISYNGSSPKFDIRTWSPDHEKMGKGITLDTSEVEELKKILDSIEDMFED